MTEEQTFYTIYSFMTKELGLYGSLLSIYAVIHGFTLETCKCNCSYSYFRNNFNIGSNSTISKGLKLLEQVGYIKCYRDYDKSEHKNKNKYEACQVYDHKQKKFLCKVENKYKKKELKKILKLIEIDDITESE